MKIINYKTKKYILFKTNKKEYKPTKTIYVRTGFLHGTKFLSEKNNGGGGAGDICRLDCKSVEVKDNLFERIRIFVEKNR